MTASDDSRLLGPAELEPLKSAFLETGWRNQGYTLGEVRVSARGIEALVDVVDFAPSATDDERFYLSTTLAAPILAQLGIIYAMDSTGETKRAPVWSREFQIENHRRVRRNRRIAFSLRCIERFVSAASEDDAGVRGVRENYRYHFDIDEGAFTGSLWLVFRRPAPESGAKP